MDRVPPDVVGHGPPTEAGQPGRAGQDSSSRSGRSQPAAQADGLDAVKDLLGRSEAEEVRLGRLAGDRYGVRPAGNVIYAEHFHVEGDVIGVSQPTAGTGRASHVSVSGRRVSEQERTKVAAVFVAATFMSQAEALLRQHRLVILRGEAGVGKATAGIHLLLGCELREIADVNPDVTADQLLAYDFQTNCGYCVCNVAAETVRHLSQYVLTGLCQRLERADAYAVLTVDARVRLETSDLVVACDRVTDLDQVFDQHLDWYLGEPDPSVNRQRARSLPGVDALIKERLVPAELDRLAELLVKAVRGEIGKDEAVRRFEASARREIENWFSSTQDLSECALLISIAALGGASYQSVADCAERLHGALVELYRRQRPVTTVTPDESPAAHLFGTSRSQRLAAVSATLIRDDHGGTTPASLVDRVEFDNPAWYSAVLRYVWDEHDLIRRPLVDWLRATCVIGDLDVRVRASAAVGELSEHDFGYMWREVITVWAGSDEPRVRDAAAFALGIPAWQNSLAPRILRTLFAWSTDADDMWRRRTAAVAFGSYWIGLRFPDAALRGLELIARSEDTRLLGVLAKSVAGLFELSNESREYAGRVLRALHLWSRPDGDSRSLRRTGLIAFVKLAMDAEGTAFTSRGNAWPPVLRLIEAGDDGAEEAEVLWVRGLAEHVTRDLALKAFKSWARQAKDDPELVKPLSQLVVRLARRGGDRGRQRLLFHLERWSRDGEQRSGAVHQMLATLSDGG